VLQAAIQRPPAERPSLRWQALAPWVSGLLYLAFFGLMVYKQWLALDLAGLKVVRRTMVPATVGTMLVLLPWLFVRPGRRQLIRALVSDLVLTLIFYADVLYFRQFGDLTSVATLRYAGQLTDVTSSVTALLRRQDLLLWLDLPLLALVALLPPKWIRKSLGPLGNLIRTLRLPLSAAALAALAGAGLVVHTTVTDHVLQEKWIGHTGLASRLGLLNYHVFDLGAYGSRMVARIMPNEASVQEVQEWFSARPAPGKSPLFGVAKGKNVIVLQLESFQALVLNLTVNGQEITPNLNRLARESLHFTEAYYQTGQGVTSDADLLTNCSLYPTRTGAVYYDYADNDFRCMPEVLREHGYTAVAMQGIRPDFWNLSAVYPHVGFQRYFSALDYQMTELIGMGLSDDAFLQQSVEKLKSLPEPYYAFLVTLTSHGPFNFEGIPRILDLGPLEGTQMADYLHAVHYTDRAVGRFLDRLREEGILDNAVLVVYGDHIGVSRYTPGFLDVLGLEAGDELALQYAERRIPLLIRLPGGIGAGQHSQVAGQVDIAPTLAGLLGISTADTYFMGRDLLACPEGMVAFYNGSALDERYLFLGDGGEGGTGRCWDRQSGEPRDLSACQSLAAKAARSLHISRLIVERNLIPDLEANRLARAQSDVPNP